MTKDRILFVDDERFFAKKYARELEKRYELLLVGSLLEGLAELQTQNEIHALILDIQMATPNGVSIYDTRNGVDTGLWFLKAHRSELTKRGMPIILLTNRKEKEIEELVNKMKYPFGQISVFYKPATPFTEFARKVENIIESGFVY